MKKAIQSLENTTLSRDETNGDQTTRHLPQHENGLSCRHIKLIAHSFFHFDSRAISTAKGSFLSIEMILWYTRNNCLFLVMDSLEQSGHGTRSIWCVANGRICYSVLFFSANGDDYGICVTIARNWVHFGECIVKPITEKRYHKCNGVNGEFTSIDPFLCISIEIENGTMSHLNIDR